MYKKNFVMLMLASILFSFGITHSMKRKKKTCTSKNIVTKKRSTGTGIIQKKQPLNGLPHQIPSLTKLCIEKVTDTFSTAFEESENGSQRIQVCQKYWDIIKNIPDKLQEEITQTIFHKLRKKKLILSYQKNLAFYSPCTKPLKVTTIKTQKTWQKR